MQSRVTQSRWWHWETWEVRKLNIGFFTSQWATIREWNCSLVHSLSNKQRQTPIISWSLTSNSPQFVFSAIDWDALVYLSLAVLIWCITFFGLCIFSHPCIPRMNPSWSWYLILMIYCILFASISVRLSACICIHGIHPQLSFLVGFFLVFASW